MLSTRLCSPQSRKARTTPLLPVYALHNHERHVLVLYVFYYICFVMYLYTSGRIVCYVMRGSACCGMVRPPAVLQRGMALTFTAMALTFTAMALTFTAMALTFTTMVLTFTAMALTFTAIALTFIAMPFTFTAMALTFTAMASPSLHAPTFTAMASPSLKAITFTAMASPSVRCHAYVHVSTVCTVCRQTYVPRAQRSGHRLRYPWQPRLRFRRGVA